MSRHLRLLREAGLVRAEAARRHHFYELDVTATDPVTMWVAGLRNTWNTAFDALGTEVYRTRREHRQLPEPIKEQTA